MIISTVKPRYNREPRDCQNLFAIQCNPGITKLYITTASLGITNDFVSNPSNSELYTMKRKPDITKPPYSQQILPFPWPFVISMFFTQWPFFFVEADSPYIDTCLNLSATATATKARP